MILIISRGTEDIELGFPIPWWQYGVENLVCLLCTLGIHGRQLLFGRWAGHRACALRLLWAHLKGSCLKVNQYNRQYYYFVKEVSWLVNLDLVIYLKGSTN